MNSRKIIVWLLVGMFTVVSLLEASSRGNIASEAYLARRKKESRGVTSRKMVEPVETEEEVDNSDAGTETDDQVNTEEAPAGGGDDDVEAEAGDATQVVPEEASAGTSGDDVEVVADESVPEIAEEAPAGISDEDAATRDTNQAAFERIRAVQLKTVESLGTIKKVIAACDAADATEKVTKVRALLAPLQSRYKDLDAYIVLWEDKQRMALGDDVLRDECSTALHQIAAKLPELEKDFQAFSSKVANTVTTVIQTASVGAPKVDLKGVVTSDRIAPPPTTIRKR